MELTEHVGDEDRRLEAFQMLTQMQRLDWGAMRRRVREIAARNSGATLGELLREHPPQAGVVEVLGYIQIARDDGHLIRSDAVEKIELPMEPGASRKLVLSAPLVRFKER